MQEVGQDLGDNHFMKTSAMLSGTGRLVASTRIWSEEAFGGFIGTVLVFSLDQDDEIIDISRQSWEVTGKGEVEGQSDKTEDWEDTRASTFPTKPACIRVVHVSKYDESELQELYSALDALAAMGRKGADVVVGIADSASNAVEGVERLADTGERMIGAAERVKRLFGG
jgi:hypothetical protein